MPTILIAPPMQPAVSAVLAHLSSHLLTPCQLCY